MACPAHWRWRAVDMMCPYSRLDFAAGKLPVRQQACWRLTRKISNIRMPFPLVPGQPAAVPGVAGGSQAAVRHGFRVHGKRQLVCRLPRSGFAGLVGAAVMAAAIRHGGRNRGRQPVGAVGAADETGAGGCILPRGKPRVRAGLCAGVGSRLPGSRRADPGAAAGADAPGLDGRHQRAGRRRPQLRRRPDRDKHGRLERRLVGTVRISDSGLSDSRPNMRLLGGTVAASAYPLHQPRLYGEQGQRHARLRRIRGHCRLHHDRDGQGHSSAGAAEQKTLPFLQEERPTLKWAGLRPATQDGYPLLGVSPEHPRVIFACGHYRNGILLSPATAAVVADLADGRQPELELASFRPDRFR